MNFPHGTSAVAAAAAAAAAVAYRNLTGGSTPSSVYPVLSLPPPTAAVSTPDLPHRSPFAIHQLLGLGGPSTQPPESSPRDSLRDTTVPHSSTLTRLHPDCPRRTSVLSVEDLMQASKRVAPHPSVLLPSSPPSAHRYPPSPPKPSPWHYLSAADHQSLAAWRHNLFALTSGIQHPTHPHHLHSHPHSHHPQSTDALLRLGANCRPSGINITPSDIIDVNNTGQSIEYNNKIQYNTIQYNRK